MLKRRTLLMVLLVGVGVTRFVPYAGEVYATYLYPSLSCVLSFLSSFIPYSLEEGIVVLALLFLLAYPLVAWLCGRRFRRMLKGELEVVGWLVVWFYVGWGCNYFRTSFYDRLMISQPTYDKAEFLQFLQEYTDSLNASYLPVEHINTSQVQSEIQDIYQSVPSGYGLCRPYSFQHPKRVLFSDLYSSVGVLGYMGPFCCESQLNSELLPLQYPFTLAHETAHLLGVSSEAEANFWAYCVCQHSDLQEVRYSGYLSMLPYLIVNARQILDEEELKTWNDRVSEQVLSDLSRQAHYWQERESAWLNNIQSTAYNWFLKGNQISSGTQNYNEVIAMVMAIRQSHEEPLRRQGRRLSVKQ